MWVLSFGPGCGITSGTTAAQLQRLALGKAFPPIAPLHVARDESAIDLQHEGAVTVSELSGDQLHWYASGELFHGPMWRLP